MQYTLEWKTHQTFKCWKYLFCTCRPWITLTNYIQVCKECEETELRVSVSSISRISPAIAYCTYCSPVPLAFISPGFFDFSLALKLRSQYQFKPLVLMTILCTRLVQPWPELLAFLCSHIVTLGKTHSQSSWPWLFDRRLLGPPLPVILDMHK